MDLLDRVAEEAGNTAQENCLGLLKPERGQAPSMLLARLSPPLKP